LSHKLARLLEILGDGKWHETDELRQLMDLRDCEVFEITDFLGKYDFAEVDHLKKRVRVNRDFKRILAQNV